jgi:spermidine synthase
MNSFTETLYDSYAQVLRVDELLFEEKTDHQHLVIFHNAAFGRVMVLDGIVQTTEKDEFIYHEMLAHTPILAHGAPQSVLIIGGGDGGMLREVTRHRSLEQIFLVEVDRRVIALCRRYLPNHSQGAFNDPRVTIVIDDGLHFVQTTDRRFDIIIVDSTDPIGPGQALFSFDFYAASHRVLRPGGVLVTQNGVPFLCLDEMVNTAAHLRRLFADWHFFGAAVPTYVGGIMAFGWASDNPSLRQRNLDNLQHAFTQSGITTRYYNPQVHRAAFVLPQYLLDAIGKASRG